MNITKQERDKLRADLREYASNPGYSHNDYADTMRQAADLLDTIDRPAASGDARERFEEAMAKLNYPKSMFRGFMAEGEWAYYEKEANLMFDAWQAASVERAPVVGLSPQLFDAHDQAVIQDIKAMAAATVQTSGWWSKALANSVLRIINHKRKQLASANVRVCELEIALSAATHQQQEKAIPPVSALTQEIPPPPEMETLADMSRLLSPPADWDADYTSIWQKLQVAERNKMQWRTYALKLHAILTGTAAAPAPETREQIRERMSRKVLAMPDAPDVIGGAAAQPQPVAEQGELSYEIREAVAWLRKAAFEHDADQIMKAQLAVFDQFRAAIAASQQVVEPIGRAILSEEWGCTIQWHIKPTADVDLYAQPPQPAQDAVDAARYQAIRKMMWVNAEGDFVLSSTANPWLNEAGKQLDATADEIHERLTTAMRSNPAAEEKP